ncbi:glycosyltransferase family 2 protein, partial [Listeria monocytogenes]|nr:glycosyltransferase family 2 protein [Listeria monocytogenes]
LIVVDDGSTDGSAAAARAAAGGDERFRLVSGKNGGEGASRNRGIRECAGKYIAFLDHDDVWLPDKTRKQVALLERDPEV